MDRRQAADGRIRKRKADNYDTNERLHKVSKRLSQLNLARSNAQSVVIPVESSSTLPKAKPPSRPPLESDSMQLDNTANKVYIYNIDDELSDSDSSSDESKLIFLPDFEKRLRNTRIPPTVLANSEGELAGRNLQTDLVLYNVPSSLSVPEDRDSVRKAIIETRARAREKQRRDQEKARTAYSDLTNGFTEPKPPVGLISVLNNAAPVTLPSVEVPGEDPDAMDLD